MEEVLIQTKEDEKIPKRRKSKRRKSQKITSGFLINHDAKPFSIEVYETRDFCTSLHFGSTEIPQKAFQCISCDQTRNSKICFQCFEKCHKQCKKKNAVVDSEPFACHCGLYLKHTVEPELVEGKINECKMMKLDKRIQNIWEYWCYDHNQRLCSICYSECHKDCSNYEMKKSSNDAVMAPCECSNENHTAFNEFTFELSANDYKSSSDIKNVWPIQIINILFSTKEIYTKLTSFVANIISEYDSSKLGQIDKAFPHVIQLLSSTFNARFKTYYYEDDILKMFPYEKLNIFMKKMETSTPNMMILKFRMMFILLFIHLRRDFQLIKAHTTVDFLSSTILERLLYRKFIFTSNVYTKEIHEKYLIDFKKDNLPNSNDLNPLKKIALNDVGYLMEKGIKLNLSFERYQGEFEIGLKFLCFMLKRMLFNKKDLVKLINSLYHFHTKLFAYLSENILENLKNVKDVFNCMAEIFYLIGVNYNDLVINEYLESMKPEEFEPNKIPVGDFIHVKSPAGSQLFKMVVKSCLAIIEHYKPKNIVLPEKVIKLFNETLRLFALADNLYFRQLSSITKDDVLEYYEHKEKLENNKSNANYLFLMDLQNSENNDKGNEGLLRLSSDDQIDTLYELKCKIENHLHAFFISSVNENLNTPQKIQDDLLDLTKKISNKIFNNVKVNEFQEVKKNNNEKSNLDQHKIADLVHDIRESNAKYFPFLVQEGFSELHEQLIDELIFSNIDETLSKVLVFFSDRSYLNILSYELLDIILSFLSLFALTPRGLKYFLMGKNLTRLNKLLNRFACKKTDKNLRSELLKNHVTNIKYTKRLLTFLLQMIKGMTTYCFNLYAHKIILRLKKNLLEHAERYYECASEEEEFEYKTHLTLILKIFFQLAPSFEYEEFEQIKHWILKIFGNEKQNFLLKENFTKNFHISFDDEKESLRRSMMISRRTILEAGVFEERDDKGIVVTDKEIDDIIRGEAEVKSNHGDSSEKAKLLIVNENKNLSKNEFDDNFALPGKKQLRGKELPKIGNVRIRDETEIEMASIITPKVTTKENKNQIKKLEKIPRDDIDPKIINLKMYFAFFNLISRNTYYTYQESENQWNKVHEFNDLENYKIILMKKNTISLRQRMVLLRFIRTMYFIDHLSEIDITKKRDHFTTLDLVNMVYFIKRNNAQANVVPQPDDILPRLGEDIDENHYKILQDKKHLLEQIESVIELFIQEIKNFPKQIEGEQVDNIESYIREIILSVKFIADFFYLEKEIWNKTIVSFYKLAKRFLMKSELLKRVYLSVKNTGTSGDLTFDQKFKNSYVKELEKKYFNLSDRITIYSFICENLENIFQETKINKDFSLGTYLDAFDNIAESNFTPFALIETKDYEYFYEEENKEEEKKIQNDSSEKKIKSLMKAYTDQFININQTNFLDVISGISNESDQVDYRRSIVDYFVTYIDYAKKEDQRYSKLVSLLCIITKMLFYDTEATQFKLEFLLNGSYKTFFENFNKQLQETFVHTLTTSKNIFVHERFLRLTNLTKLIIQFLQLLAEGFNNQFHMKIFGLKNKDNEEYDEDENSELVTLPNNPSAPMNENEALGSVAKAEEEGKITFYENIVNNLRNTFFLMDLERKMDAEMPYDKLIVLTTNLIDFIVEYIESKNEEIKTIIKDKMMELLSKGIFKSLLFKIPLDQSNHNKYITRRKIICYIKIKFVHLLISYLQTGGKVEVMKTLLKDYSPSVLFEEILFNFNDLILILQEKGIVKKDLYVYNTQEFVNALEFLYVYEEDFRDSLQLTVCCKLYILIKILEDVYGNNSLKQHFEMLSYLEDNASIFTTGGKSSKKSNLNKTKEEDIIGIFSPLAYKLYKFLEKIVLKVEIKYVDEDEEDEKKREKNHESFFVRPSLTFYLSRQSMTSFITNVKRESAFSKLNDLISYTDYFMFEMVSNSHIVGRRLLSRWLSDIEYYHLELFNYLIIVVHNLLIISHFYRSADLPDEVYDVVKEEDRYQYFPDNLWLAVSQIAFIVCVLIVWMRYKFPLYFQHNLMKTYNRNFLFRKRSDNGKKVISKKIIDYFGGESTCSVNSIIKELNSDLSGMKIFLVGLGNTILLNREICILVYTLILLILYIATKSYMWLAIPSLFVANISPTLYDIFKAVKMRYKQLTTVLLFTYLLVYIFMWITYFFMTDILDFDSKSQISESFCHSSIQCLLIMIDYGVRSGGGIGDILPKVSYKTDYKFFVKKFFYDMLFHIIIILVLGNIFLGIIVDTFADLRDQNQLKEEDLKNVCFICQMSRDKSLIKNIDFEKHVEITHFTWNYVYFLTYLHIGNPNDFNGMQNYVWDKLGDQDITWIPIESD